MPTLDQFERYGAVQAGGKHPMATLGADRRLSLNMAAIRQFSLDEYRYAVLYFNREEYMIALRFSNDSDEKGAMRLSVQQSAIHISTTGFLSHYGIVHTRTARYRIEVDAESECYLIDLKHPLPPRNRRAVRKVKEVAANGRAR